MNGPKEDLRKLKETVGQETVRLDPPPGILTSLKRRRVRKRVSVFVFAATFVLASAFVVRIALPQHPKPSASDQSQEATVLAARLGNDEIGQFSIVNAHRLCFDLSDLRDVGIRAAAIHSRELRRPIANLIDPPNMRSHRGCITSNGNGVSWTDLAQEPNSHFLVLHTKADGRVKATLAYQR